MADGFEIKITGLGPVVAKMKKIKVLNREYGVRLGCKATGGAVSKPVPGKKTERHEVREARTAGQNVIIVRFHAKGGRIDKRDAEGNVETTAFGKARWKKIYVGVGPNKRFVKRVLVRAGKRLEQERAVKREVPSRNIQFFSEQEMATGNALWRDGAVEILSGQRPDPDKILTERSTDIGRHMVSAYQSHLDKSQGVNGALKPVMPGTQKSKERQTGKKGLPSLVRTGQLRDSFIYEIKRYR